GTFVKQLSKRERHRVLTFALRRLMSGWPAAVPDDELPQLPFASTADWEAWLEENHATSEGVWIKMAKKGSGIDSVRYPEVFETLSSQNRYAILYRLQDAKKPETRARRLAKFVAMLEAGEAIY